MVGLGPGQSAPISKKCLLTIPEEGRFQLDFDRHRRRSVEFIVLPANRSKTAMSSNSVSSDRTFLLSPKLSAQLRQSCVPASTAPSRSVSPSAGETCSAGLSLLN